MSRREAASSCLPSTPRPDALEAEDGREDALLSNGDAEVRRGTDPERFCLSGILTASLKHAFVYNCFQKAQLSEITRLKCDLHF